MVFDAQSITVVGGTNSILIFLDIFCIDDSVGWFMRNLSIPKEKGDVRLRLCPSLT